MEKELVIFNQDEKNITYQMRSKNTKYTLYFSLKITIYIL